MKKSLLPVSIALIFIALLGNNYRMWKEVKKTKQEFSIDVQRMEYLESEKEAFSKKEREMLEQNALLVNQINELKNNLEIKPRTIIKFKKNEKHPINGNASESYTNLLSIRYLTKQE
jgi:hypothetical protein